MIINHNMASLNTYRQLSINETNTQKSLEKLSSGLRINRAGDDAAGLAISEKMRGQIRGLDQATRNAQDATSLLNTAEGNLNEVHSILQRMKELATQAGNDTNVGVDRGEIQKEINQLTSEINRIGNTTEFNTQKLLNGGAESTDLAITTATKGTEKGIVSGVTSTTGTAAKAAVFDTGALTALTAGQSGTITFNGATVNITVDGATAAATQANVSGNSINLTLHTGTDSTQAAQATAIAAAFNSMKGYSGSPLANFTIAAATTDITFTATAADGDKYNNQVITTSGNVTIASTTGATQLTTPGVTAVKGQFSFSIDKMFNAGDTIVLGADTFTGASASKAGLAADQFDIDGDATAQAKSLADAIIKANDADLAQKYDITTAGSNIIFTEKTASASAAPAMGAVTSTATAGVYDVTVDDTSMVKDGGKYTIDGVDIKVTTDATDAGIAKGTSMLVGTDKYEQAANLKNAISLNSTLSVKYKASLGSPANQVVLTQQTGQESRIAPEVSTNTKYASGFEAKFQIGANTAQSMTVQINDMRSKALHISGTKAGDTITASNGVKAALCATKEVTDGTDDTNVEYSLDVSSHDKATAAISVLEDAIENVSAERSKLGAYTNRLEHTINNLGTSSENMTAAESRIRDVDMAKEMMSYQKNNILQQAAQAMLAQANQQPQGVLQLLR